MEYLPALPHCIQWIKSFNFQQLLQPQSDISGGAQSMTQELVLDKLPEDILNHIHSLLPLKDAARAACVSHGILHSWRCYSTLILNTQTLGLTREKLGSDKEIEIHLIEKVDHILNNHCGIVLKTLKLDLFPCDSISASYLDRWLQTSVKSGINELSLVVSTFMEQEYNFPCSILSDDTAARSIQSLHLYGCAFQPTETLGWLARLKILELYFLKITDEGLGHLLSKSFALEQLEVGFCDEITCLKMPCKLQHLKSFKVVSCKMIKLVEINAPKLSSFHYGGTQAEINVRDPAQLKDVELLHIKPFGILSYVYAKLSSIAPNVGSLTLLSRNENFSTPVLPVKFPLLKKMEIQLRGSVLALWPSCDFFSLIPYLDGAPALESFILRVDLAGVEHDSVVAVGDEELRRKPECRHHRLKRVMIKGFCSTKSMVEFTRHILESTPSLECLTLDTTISGRVPSAVEYTILKPCIHCHEC